MNSRAFSEAKIALLHTRMCVGSSITPTHLPPPSHLGKCCSIFCAAYLVKAIRCVGYWPCSLFGRPHGPCSRCMYAASSHAKGIDTLEPAMFVINVNGRGSGA